VKEIEMLAGTSRETLSAVAVVCLGMATTPEIGSAQSLAPDTIYVNGHVVTVDANFSIKEAFAVKGERFVSVGTNSAMRKLAGPTTRVIDLRHRSVFPGFVDTHPHTINGHAKQDELHEVSLHGVRSIAEIVRRIKAATASMAAGAWVVTTDIGEPPDYFNVPSILAEKRWPTKRDLDLAAPANPVYINCSTKQPYPVILNSAALALLGVTRGTTDDKRVHVEKDATGDPTGVIYGLDMYSYESRLRSQLLTLLPPVPDEVRKEVITAAISDNAAVGVTSLYEAHGLQPVNLRYLTELNSAAALHNRFVLAYEVPVRKSLEEIDAWMAAHKEASGSGTGDDAIRVHGVTVSMDGAIQFGASLMTKPYLDPDGRLGNGSSSVSTEKLTQIAKLALKHDLRLNIQAAGDEAIAMAVEALETVNRETPLRDKHWVVEHVQHPSREHIKILSDLGVFATTYSSVDFSKGADVYVKRFPGQDVWKTVIPLRWWIDGGVTIAQSTDGAHYEPMFTIWESLVRVDGRTGQSMLTPAKTISRKEAIQIYTINGARVMQLDDRIGSIESGKYADFAVLDHDILTCATDEIRNTNVLLTVLGGKPIYDSHTWQ
jgi:predicted amidohydrolase YtcJ